MTVITYREAVARRIQERDETPYNEVLGVKKDGTRFPIEVFVKNQMHKGHFRRVVVCRDITSRKHTEELIKIGRAHV